MIMVVFVLFLVSFPHTSHFSSLPSGVVSAFPMTEAWSARKLKTSPIKNMDSVSSSTSPLPPAELHFSLVDTLSSASASWRMRMMPLTAAHDYSDLITGSHENSRQGNSESEKRRVGHAGKGSATIPKWREAKVVDVVREEGESQYRTVSLLLSEEEDDLIGSTSAKKNHKKKKTSPSHAAERRAEEKEHRDDSSQNGDGRKNVEEGREANMDERWVGNVPSEFERMVCEEYNVLVPRTTTIHLSDSEGSDVNDEEEEEAYSGRPSRRSPMSDASVRRRGTTRARQRASHLDTNRFGRCYFTVVSMDTIETNRKEEEWHTRGGDLSSATSQNVRTDVEPFFTYRVRVPSATESQKRSRKKRRGEKEDRSKRPWEDDVVDDDDGVRHTGGHHPYHTMEEADDSLPTGSSSNCEEATSSYFRCSITSLNQYISIDQLSDVPPSTGEIRDENHNGDEKAGENDAHEDRRQRKAEGNEVGPSSFSATASRGTIAVPLYALTIEEPRIMPRERGTKGEERKHTRHRSSPSAVAFQFDGEEGKECRGLTSYFRMILRISALSPSSNLPSTEQESKVDLGSSSSSSVSSPTGNALTMVEKQKMEKQKEILNVARFHDIELQLYSEMELFAGAKQKAQELERTRKGISSVFRRWVYPLWLLLLFYLTLVAMKSGVQRWNQISTFIKTKIRASEQTAKEGAAKQSATLQRRPETEGKYKKD